MYAPGTVIAERTFGKLAADPRCRFVAVPPGTPISFGWES